MDDDDELANLLSRHLAQVVAKRLAEASYDLSIPSVYWHEGLDRRGRPADDGWDGPSPEDPLTLYILVTSHKHADFKVAHPVSLRALVREFLENALADIQNGHSPEDASYAPGMRRFAAGLRELADEIDKVYGDCK